MEHRGVCFPPDYAPHGVALLYDGAPLTLTPPQEEYATFYASVAPDGPQLGNAKTAKIFNRNFWDDFKAVLGPDSVVKDFSKCDFTVRGARGRGPAVCLSVSMPGCVGAGFTALWRRLCVLCRRCPWRWLSDCVSVGAVCLVQRVFCDLLVGWQRLMRDALLCPSLFAVSQAQPGSLSSANPTLPTPSSLFLHPSFASTALLPPPPCAAHPRAPGREARGEEGGEQGREGGRQGGEGCHAAAVRLRARGRPHREDGQLHGACAGRLGGWLPGKVADWLQGWRGAGGLGDWLQRAIHVARHTPLSRLPLCTCHSRTLCRATNLCPSTAPPTLPSPSSPLSASPQVEPPGLFRGRGEHPRMGTVKRRVQPEDVTLNVGSAGVVPPCPIPGHAWKRVVHDPTSRGSPSGRRT